MFTYIYLVLSLKTIPFSALCSEKVKRRCKRETILKNLGNAEAFPRFPTDTKAAQIVTLAMKFPFYISRKQLHLQAIFFIEQIQQHLPCNFNLASSISYNRHF